MSLPSGTVTLLFTDIAGSTKLWQEHPQAMPLMLARHDTLLRTAIEHNNGFVVKTIGDAFMAVFPTPHDALNASLVAQRSLFAEPWPQETPVRVRMGLHMGVTEGRDNDYFGHEVNRAARIQGVVHPQQIVLSQAVYEMVKECLPDAATLLDLGLHQLKDLRDPEHLWQLCHPDLPAVFPPINSLTHWPNNLPRQATSFIGREKEMEEIKTLLAYSACLTLTGIGGTGKTRLALQVAAEMLPSFPNGAFFVELAALTDPHLVPQTVATSLGLREEPGKTLTQTLVDYIQSRTLLLVLDNCEHLLDASARLAETLVKSCPNLKILATSRERLNIPVEQPWGVPCLSLPEQENMGDAITLFVERARIHQADFSLTPQNALTLSQLCRQLDGIPFALELAAARMRVLPVEQILLKLEDRFKLLTGGSRVALPRQQTLRALIDWSYDLLIDKEKAFLLRLSLFAGGWSLPAAEQVCAGEGIEPWEALDLLTALVDKSLVIYTQDRDAPRYLLLEMVRQYTWEKLVQSGETTAVQNRYINYYLHLAEREDPDKNTKVETTLHALLETEHDNLRHVLSLCQQEPGSQPIGLKLVGLLQQFWWTQGYLAEGYRHSIVALDSPNAQEPTGARSKALNGAGTLACLLGDYSAARAHYQESLDLWKQLEDREGTAGTLLNLANVLTDQGDNAAGLALYGEALTLYHALGNRIGEAAALGNMGMIFLAQDDDEAAWNYLTEAVKIVRDQEERYGIALTLSNLSLVAARQGKQGEARAYLEEGLSIQRELGDRRGIMISLVNLGPMLCEQGDLFAARSCLKECLLLCRESGDKRVTAYALEGVALLTQTQQQLERTVRLYGAAQALRQAIGCPLPSHHQEEQDRRLAEYEALLGKDAYTAAIATGQAFNFEQAIEYATRNSESD